MHPKQLRVRHILASTSLALGGLMIAPNATSAEAGDWLIRTGPAGVFPNDDSDTVFGGEVGVDDGYGLGLTVSYRATDRFGVELLGSTPISHDLEGEAGLSALGDVGEVDQLSPTLSLQYYPQLGTEWVDPYVGAGLTYTAFFDEDSSPSLTGALGDPNASIDVDNTFSPAAQIGADWPVTERIALNTSLWYIDLDTEAAIEAQGTTTNVDVDIDPWVAMIGARFRF